jgi:Integrase core domain
LSPAILSRTAGTSACHQACGEELPATENFDRFIDWYNHGRPHQALNMKYPGELYVSSLRPYKG